MSAEFFLIILQVLAQHLKPAPTLASHLRVNKHIPSLTLPFLHRDPYPKYHSHNNDMHCNGDNPIYFPVRTGRFLTRMLLGGITKKDLPKVLSSTAKTKTPSSSFNYLAHQLQSIIIPLSAIQHFLRAVRCLQSLERVQFLLDRAFDHNRVKTNQPPNSAQDKAIRLMLDFVKKHMQLCNCFKAVSGQPPPPTVVSGHPSKSVPRRSSRNSFGSFLRCTSPKFWMSTTGLAFSPGSSTDLSHLETIDGLPSPTITPFFNLVHKNPEFLQSCRALRDLKMISPGSDTLKWAVQEKNDLESMDDTEANGHSSETAAQSAYL
ncbi:hypothetical protein BGX29_002037 [Mortierella sp. GBA35]|nr:hypothetical protein BGX29_002037 [Mortierella sp. GBA35]